DRGARGAGPSHRLPRRERHVRRDVRRRPHGRAARVHRRPDLSRSHAKDAAVAGIDMPGGPLAGPAGGAAAYRWPATAGWGFARVFSLVALAVAWELAARSGAFTLYMLPALSAVLARIWSDLVAGDLVLNTGVTLYRALTGFLIGAVAGVAMGMAISRNRFTHWFFDPIISV